MVGEEIEVSVVFEDNNTDPFFYDVIDRRSLKFKICPCDNSKRIFIPWRVGAYVAGDTDAVKNTWLLLDGYFQKEIKSSTGEPIFVELYPQKG